MHKINFFPIGNADSCLIQLDNNKTIIVDYAHKKDNNDDDDKRIDLESSVKEVVGKFVDVLAITHADDDHVHGFSNLFFLEHAHKYQSENRIKIKELWVPAAVILEKNLENDALILRAEARYRLKNGKGIKVFSKPEKLEQWLEGEGIKLKDRLSNIVHAGNVVPSFKLDNDGVEFFIHSPFSETIDNEEIDRNNSCLVMQAKFKYENEIVNLILGADAEFELWEDIIKVTKHYKREDRLNWDLFKVPHHCSYTALSDEKGDDITVPKENIKWLYKQGNDRGHLISSSNPIPTDDNDKLPPHRQAAKYYKSAAKGINGEFNVTMEFPSKKDPKIMVFKIDENKVTLIKELGASIIGIVSEKPSPRVG